MAFDAEFKSLQQQTDKLIVEEARNLIEREGWVQGSFKGNEGGYCILGALFHVSGYRDSTSGRPYEKMKMVAHRRTGISSVAYANDHVLKTKEEAMAFMDEVISEL